MYSSAADDYFYYQSSQDTAATTDLVYSYFIPSDSSNTKMVTCYIDYFPPPRSQKKVESKWLKKKLKKWGRLTEGKNLR